jgi:xanthine dehydrogenase iron-sulfur cluster and FAD-binding subunit A
MKPAPFEYFAPTDIAEALDLLAHYGDEAKILAGGQSLMPLMNMRLARPSVLVDINRLSALSHIALDTNGALAIGALTRQRAIERASLIQTHYPLLAAVMPSIGHFQIRNRGTIGGSIVHADPAAELPALCLALEAEFVLHSSVQQRTSGRRISFAPISPRRSSPSRCSRRSAFPWQAQWRWGFQDLPTRGDFALVGAVAVLRMDNGAVCQAARLSMFGVEAQSDRRGRRRCCQDNDWRDGCSTSWRMSWRPSWSRIRTYMPPPSIAERSAGWSPVGRSRWPSAMRGDTTSDDSAAEDSVDSER